MIFREKARNAKLIVAMSGNSTKITNPEVSFILLLRRKIRFKMRFLCHFQDSNDTKTFTFDFSYWSHDGFKENKEGYFAPESSKYADQTKVTSPKNLTH